MGQSRPLLEQFGEGSSGRRSVGLVDAVPVAGPLVEASDAFGPLVGAAIVIYLDNLLSQFGQWRTVTFGLLLTFLFIYFQDGILPMARTMYEERGVRDRLAGLRSGE